MAKKKAVKKKTSKKKPMKKKTRAQKKSKKKVSKSKKKVTKRKSPSKSRKVKSQRKSNKKINRMKFAFRDFILFTILTILSYVLYLVSNNELFDNTFFLLSIIFGAIALTFLVIYLALFFAKSK